MNQRQLSYFLEVYKTRSISRAAENMYISPQGISKTIRELENELGVALFVHDKNKITATTEAAKLAIHARKILSEYEIIEQKLFTGRNTIIPLQISCSYDTGLMLGTEFFIEFMRHHPDIRLQLRESMDAKIGNQLENGKVEMAIMSNPMNLDEYECYPIFRDSYCLIVHKDHPLAGLDLATIEDLDNYPLICRDTTSADSMHHFSVISQNSVEFNIPLECTNSRFITEMVIANAGAAMMLKCLTKYINCPDVMIIPFRDKHLIKTLYLAHKKDVILSSEAELFKSEILSCMSRKE